jgi:serine/threonine protein kinase
VLQEHQRLGDFEIIRPLGKGGMGEVYEAQQGNPPRRVALKVLASWLAEDDEALERFWREAAVPAQLDHPSIVPIISSGRTEDGIAYYTMRLVRGPTLAKLLRAAAQTPQPATVLEQTTSEHPRPPGASDGDFAVEPPASAEDVLPELLQEYRRDRFGLAVRVGIQAGRALAAAHRVGVLHRDVKPSNLMIDGHRQVYVVDFGLTKALTGDGMSTRPGVVCGTPWYMSPEQGRGEAIDARTDIFALGVTLYELVTGGLGPYTASRQDGPEVLRQVRSGQVLPVRGLAPDIPRGLERVVQRALQFKATRRYQVAEEMVGDLERLEQRRQSDCRTASSRTARSGRKPLLGVTLASVLLLAAFVTLPWLARTKDSSGEVSVPTSPIPPSMPPDASPEPLPDILRGRVPGHRIALILENGDPLWGCRLLGNGKYHPQEDGLTIASIPSGSPTLLALDDTQARWFDLTIELRQTDHRLSDQAHALGIFFGWHARPLDPERIARFFVINLEDFPRLAATQPQLTVGSAKVIPPRGARGQSAEWCSGLPGVRSVVLPPRAPSGWRHLRIQARQEAVTVTIDAAPEPQVRIDLPSLTANAPTAEMDPRGVLGAWVEHGVGAFRQAAVAVYEVRR